MNSPAQRDPALRPFRAASWALYLLGAVGFSLLVVYSVTKGAFTAQAPPPVAKSSAGDDCRSSARRLFDELEVERVAIVDPSRREAHFVAFRADWEARFELAQSHCPRESAIFESLKAILVSYGVDVGRYSESSAQAVDAFQQLVGKPSLR